MIENDRSHIPKLTLNPTPKSNEEIIFEHFNNYHNSTLLDPMQVMQWRLGFACALLDVDRITLQEWGQITNRINREGRGVF